MTLQEKLLKRLRPWLRTGQFDELCFRLDLDVTYLSGPQAPPIQRGIELIRWAEQDAARFGYLQQLLDDLDWFKDFLPEGAYPVGQQLLEREEARERQAMDEATVRGENAEDYRVTTEKFYTFKPEAAWLGVFRDWDTPLSFHSELVQRVIRASYGQGNCPAAAIIGPGGSGKSVALRRLAIDLVKQGYEVWWVDEPERLLRFGLSQVADIGDVPHFLLVDDIQSLEHEYARRFQRDLKKNRSLILVVAGRSLPAAFRATVGPGGGLFVPDEAADRVSILAKVAEMIPAWAETAEQLAAEPLREARLIRVLVVLARRKAPPHNLKELETAFLEILADDVSRIYSIMPGLAEAVIDAAAIRQVRCDVSRETLIALADYHQPRASIPTLLEQINGNLRWQALTPLLSYDPEYGVLRFHHDELAEGIISAGQRGLLGSRPIGDEVWRRATLELVISRGSTYSSSYALSGFVRNCPGLIGKERTLGYIHQLLDAGNGHHAYLRLIVDEALALDEQERLDLLLDVSHIVPFNRWLWGTVWGWIQRHYREKEQRAKVLEQLYQAGCQAYSILIPLLRYLPLERSRIVAKQLLADPATYPYQVICSCLNLLGEEAKPEARRLLVESNDKEVICSCLDLLGEEAKPEARRLLVESNNKEVICSCLDLLGEEAKPEARRLLADPATYPYQVLCSCLNLLGEEAKPEARRLLADPATHPYQVLCSCLNLLGEEAKPEARRLLVESNDKEVICSCLNLLGEEAKPEARRLLVESNDKEVICSCLDLLGEEAKPEAKRLLADPTTHPEVICSCLKVLGEDAQPFAIEQIRNWRKTVPVALIRCFQVAGGTPEAQNATGEMLTAWDDILPMLRVAALRAPFDTPLRVKHALEVLNNWHRQYRPLVSAALTAFWNNPHAVTGYCRAILRRWRTEILYQIKHHQSRYDGHIIKALSHPALRGEAGKAIQDMLSAEATSPGFLSAELRQQAENIMQGQWPLWSASEG